ncbi:hypothetical protein ACGFJ7_29055 [Actinoplanes sp. NPDC048988]
MACGVPGDFTWAAAATQAVPLKYWTVYAVGGPYRLAARSWRK